MPAKKWNEENTVEHPIIAWLETHELGWRFETQAAVNERYRSDAKWAERFKADDPESVNEVLRPACKENGITQEEYEWALSEDKTLHELQQTSIAEALANK